MIERGLRIAASAGDDFRSLLAAGLALVVGVQAFIIAAGNLKLIPLTGITLPFISYGGSSLLVNGIVVGLLLALSDKGVEPPPPPETAEPHPSPGRQGASHDPLAARGRAGPHREPAASARLAEHRPGRHRPDPRVGDHRRRRRLLAGLPIRRAEHRSRQPGRHRGRAGT